MKKNNIVTFRIRAGIHEEIKKSGEFSQSVNESVENFNSRGRPVCPSCNKNWPQENAQINQEENKAVSFSATDKVIKMIDKLKVSSKFIHASLLVKCGFCPVCEQKIKGD